MGNTLLSSTDAAGSAAGGGLIMIVYIVLIFVSIYLFLYDPSTEEGAEETGSNAVSACNR